jgi:succinylglutamate desuccinylase
MPAIDKQAQRGDTTDFPAKSLRAVTPNDTNELEYVAKALFIGTGGTLSLIAKEHTSAVSLTVGAGQIVPVRAKIVRATGTTATGIVALI